MSLQPKNKTFYITYATFYFFVNLLTLNRYPLMHSDEAWLAGLTRTMMETGHLMVTEPFFDLAPRTPHTLKTIYHLLQMPFLMTTGYSLFSVRLLSLLFGLLCFFPLFFILNKKSSHPFDLLLPTIFFTCSNQFIYAAHFARQEILLVFILLVSYSLFASTNLTTAQKMLLTSGLIGLGIGLHPNAFIIAVMIGCLYLYDWLCHKISFKHLLLFVLPMAVIAMLHSLITLSSTEHFLSNYWQYASELSVGAAPISRLDNFIGFYLKIYHQISGTYFLPNLKPLFLISASLFILTIIAVAMGKLTLKKAFQLGPFLMMAFGFNTAIFIIGRYNPTSIIFLVVVLLLMSAHIVTFIPSKKLRWLCLSALIFFQLISLKEDYDLFKYHDYTLYNQFLQTHISPDDYVLANLSAGFALAPDQFLDIRNLKYLGDESLEAYIKTRGINTIIYYEEYDYIHRNPQWQILYGNDDLYYDPLNDLMSTYGTLRAETTSAYYGNRIIRYLGDYPWIIKIYDIDLEAID